MFGILEVLFRLRRLELFRMLTQDGKDLKFFEEEAGPFLLRWMRDVISSSKMPDYLHVLVNVMKYNAAYVDEEVVTGFVLYVQIPVLDCIWSTYFVSCPDW